MIEFRDILTAHDRIKSYIHRTPVLTSQALNSLTGADLYFKCDNFQKAGSFKIRGAANAVFSLTDHQASKGVVTHSSGNFAQALALAAKWRGIPAYIVMPSNVPVVKREAVIGYGGQITWCEPTLAARESTTAQVISKTGANFIHPSEDYPVISGQGSAALELLQDFQGIEIVITPVGGGGLLSGTAIATHGISKNIVVVAGEPKNADDAFRSMQAGHIIPSLDPKTIADGLLTSLGDHTFEIMRDHVRWIITVSEEMIIKSMKYVWERMKIIIEPSSAVALAAIFTEPEQFSGKKVGVILSGGNLDVTKIKWV